MLFSSIQRIPVVRQSEVAECGLAAMTMIAAAFGHDLDLATMRRRFPQSIRGARIQDLCDIADTLQIEARAIKVHTNKIRHVQTPALLHWEKKHFVVLIRVTSLHVTLHDPAEGRRQISMKEFETLYSGVAIEFQKRPDFSAVKERQSLTLSKLLSFAPGWHTRIPSILVLAFIGQAAILLAPLFTQLIIDSAIPNADFNLLFLLIAGAFIVQIIGALGTILRTLSVVALAAYLRLGMTGRVVGRMLRLTMPYYETRSAGDVLSRINSMQPIEATVNEGVIAIIIGLFITVISSIFLLIYQPIILLIVAIFIAITTTLNVGIYYYLRRVKMEEVVARAREQSVVIENMRAHLPIKLFNAERVREGVWRSRFIASVNRTSEVRVRQALADEVVRVVDVAQTLAVVTAAAMMVISGSISLGVLFAALAYSALMFSQAQQLIGNITAIRLLSVHLERVADLMHAPVEAPDDQAMSGSAIRFSGISAKEVHFAYSPTDRPVLTGANFEIKEGDFCAFVGRSGGGKTTLLKLILGLHVPTSGQVEISGEPLAGRLVNQWRRSVGVVMQDDTLLSGTLLDNVTMFDDNPDFEAVDQAIRRAQIFDDISSMRMGLNSHVGDMGLAISGGQRQRVLLARALYRQPNVLLLDEGTANLDPQTEDDLADTLAELGLTIIAVAHRPAFIRRSNKVILVEGGETLETTPEGYLSMPH